MEILYDIITIGSNTVDVFVKTKVDVLHEKNKKHKDKLFLAYPVGGKLLIEHMDIQIGGGGTNTATSFARLGLKTAYLGKIGKDENGLKVFNLLKKEKIDFIGPIGQTTGYSVILDSIKEDRTILTHKGSNDKLSYKEIHKNVMQTKWFYMSSMIGESLNTLIKIAEYAKKQQIKIAFNPSIYQTSQGIKKIKPILQATNIIVLNKEEAQSLTKKNDINSMLKFLFKHIKDYVIITDGKNGAYLYDGLKKHHAKPKKNLKIEETTGAGDAFASAFVYAIIRKKDIKTALKYGFVQAESVIQAYGSKNKLLTNKEITTKVKNDKRKIIQTTLR